MSPNGLGDEIQLKIYTIVTDLVAKVADLTTTIALREDHRSQKDEEYERRLQNHGDRIRDLEQKEAARADHGEAIKELNQAIGEVRDAVNKQSWIPVIATGVLVSIIAGITIYIITGG